MFTCFMACFIYMKNLSISGKGEIYVNHDVQLCKPTQMHPETFMKVKLTIFAFQKLAEFCEIFRRREGLNTISLVWIDKYAW